MDWSLFISPNDSSLREIVWRHFHCNLIARQNTDVVHTEFSADRSKYDVSVLQFYLKHSVRQLLCYYALNLNYICFRHSIYLPAMISE